MARPSPLRNEHGFTIVEVLVAATILLVGILGVTTMVNSANSTTTSNKAREQGLSLARDLIESARSVRYQALSPSTVVPTVQAMDGFANTGQGAGWTVERRGIVYHVALGVCSVDDDGDLQGARVANAFCARSVVQASPDTCGTLIGTPARINGAGGSPGLDGGDCGLDTNLDGQVDNLLQAGASSCPSGTSVPAGTCDAQPDDFKRLVALVTWDKGAGRRYVLQQATVPFPGLSAYGAMTSLTLRGYTAGANGYAVTDNPSSLTFDAQSSQEADQVNWILAGVDQGQATWSGTTGFFSWPIGNADPSRTSPASGEVVDGTYTVGARVQDAGGIHGVELDVSVVLNRRVPFAPGGFTVARNASGAVTGTWNAPADHDIVGYTMYRQTGANITVVCSQITARTCTDANPPGGSVDYWVRAVDLDPAGAPRLGVSSVIRTVTSTNAAPTAPTNLTAGTPFGNGANKSVPLTWTAATDPDSALQYYAIYRDGVRVAFSNTGSPPPTTYTDTAKKGSTYKYEVSAIDDKGLEGPKSDPIFVTVS